MSDECENPAKAAEPPLPWLAIDLERASLLAEAHDLAFYFAEGHRDDLKSQIATLTAQLAEARVLLERAAETLAGDAHEKTRRGVCEGCAVLFDISAFLSSPAPASTDPRNNQIYLPAEPLYLINKGGFYYRENCRGYTSNIDEAGRYSKDVAEREAAVEPWHMKAILAPPRPINLANQICLLKAAIRLTALRWVPGITHEQIDAHIEAILRGETVPMGELARFATKPGDAP